MTEINTLNNKKKKTHKNPRKKKIKGKHMPHNKNSGRIGGGYQQHGGTPRTSIEYDIMLERLKETGTGAEATASKGGIGADVYKNINKIILNLNNESNHISKYPSIFKQEPITYIIKIIDEPELYETPYQEEKPINVNVKNKVLLHINSIKDDPYFDDTIGRFKKVYFIPADSTVPNKREGLIAGQLIDSDVKAAWIDNSKFNQGDKIQMFNNTGHSESIFFKLLKPNSIAPPEELLNGGNYKDATQTQDDDVKSTLDEIFLTVTTIIYSQYLFWYFLNKSYPVRLILFSFIEAWKDTSDKTSPSPSSSIKLIYNPTDERKYKGSYFIFYTYGLYKIYRLMNTYKYDYINRDIKEVDMEQMDKSRFEILKLMDGLIKLEVNAKKKDDINTIIQNDNDNESVSKFIDILYLLNPIKVIDNSININAIKSIHKLRLKN